MFVFKDLCGKIHTIYLLSAPNASFFFFSFSFLNSWKVFKLWQLLKFWINQAFGLSIYFDYLNHGPQSTIPFGLKKKKKANNGPL
jgi:hypothetical protein